MDTPTRRTQLPTHVYDSLPKLAKSTQPLECYWTKEQTNNLPSQNSPTRTAETCMACCLCCTGQTDGLRLSDQWHLSDRWTEPVRTVGTTATQQVFKRALVTSLGPRTRTLPKHKLHGRKTLHKALQNNSKQTKNWPAAPRPKDTRVKHFTRGKSHKWHAPTQRHTSQAFHPRQIPQVACTGQIGHTHRSDQSSLGSSGWTTPAGQLPKIKLPISRIAPRICTRLWG
jgi:hypothetical protein